MGDGRLAGRARHDDESSWARRPNSALVASVHWRSWLKMRLPGCWYIRRKRTNLQKQEDWKLAHLERWDYLKDFLYLPNWRYSKSCCSEDPKVAGLQRVIFEDLWNRIVAALKRSGLTSYLFDKRATLASPSQASSVSRVVIFFWPTAYQSIGVHNWPELNCGKTAEEEWVQRARRIRRDSTWQHRHISLNQYASQRHQCFAAYSEALHLPNTLYCDEIVRFAR